ncbi:MAG: putative DNA repair protein MutK [Psychromonas sp.]|jgi:predicted DNA repair protein MutK
MAGLSLLTLLDDIASVLDDVAAMSKVAARKTAGVLGDDLALNAQQVSGVRAEREIPVVWGVAKGSFLNKIILVPAALLISAVAPWLILPLLLIGGLFLCFEGAEKIHEKFFEHGKLLPLALAENNNYQDLIAYEKKKIKAAIRTDFILSAEIIAIVLGIVQELPLFTQLMVMSTIGILVTVLVYGLVACIVKLDDLGFYLQRKSAGKGIRSVLGNGLIALSPKLMKLLTIVGTIAMFLVGGGIVIHSIPYVHYMVENIIDNLPVIDYVSKSYVIIANGLIGLMSGFIVLFLVSLKDKLKTILIDNH